MTNIVQESAVLLGMIQGEKRKVQGELVELRVSKAGDSVTTTPQMQALSRNMLLHNLERDLQHFIQEWIGEGGQ